MMKPCRIQAISLILVGRHCQSKVAGLSYFAGDRELGRPKLTPLGECSGAIELEIVP